VPGKPTAMDWGPDGRLYVLDVIGNIYALTIDTDSQTVQDTETIPGIQPRLALGLTIDPDSTASNVTLWVSHSDLDQANGAANSGIISKLSGPGFTNRQDVITGLPRAIANHATNSIHFGPDGRLYIAQGGNTGAGLSNSGASEFGPRPEQPLSAAILVADVKAPGFDGSCASLIDPNGSVMDATGIAARDVPCDVQIYASGLRNPYDLTFHSNGKMYATENGLGVVGTFPDLLPDDLNWVPGDGCEGMIQGITAITNHFPGDRPDLLQLIQPGGYYGHPNPSRDECVFFGGNPTDNLDYPVLTTSEQMTQTFMETDRYSVGREPEPNWYPPIFSFGDYKSANGVIEYSSDSTAFCGQLDGDLLVTYFSQSDQIRRLKLSSNGKAVVSELPLIRSSALSGGTTLSNPLPLTQDPDGRIYVGEFGIGQVTVFDPKNIGVWTSSGLPDLPVALLDAGSTVVNGKLYVVAGKTSTSHQRTLYAFDPLENGWETLSSLPLEYPEVENPAVTSTEDKLYVFGGLTSAFSGATNKAAVYDPGTDSWSILPDVPTARGGAAAQSIDDKIYVAGGLSAAGDSLTVLEVYDLATGTWSAGPDLSIPLDNPGSAAISGKMYLFGGRTITNGDVVDGTLNRVEILEPGVGWTPGAAMPTGRRTMSVAVYNGEAIVMGGERTPEGNTFQASEGYDPVNNRWRLLTDLPVGRHGAVAGMIDNVIYIAGGGALAGTSFSRDMDGFTFDCSVKVGVDLSLFLPMIYYPPLPGYTLDVAG
jgi:N-acetylneuraminic acid mutarotase